MSKVDLSTVDFWGTAVKDERDVIVAYEGGVCQSAQNSVDLPTSVVLANLVKHDYTGMFGIGDYEDVHNLVVWCWLNEVTSNEVIDILDDWECTHGPHVPNAWSTPFINSLGWPW